MGSRDEEHFTALFECTHQALLAYAIRRVDSPGDAADIVAETFLVAWRRLDEVPPGDQARPWLFGVARRVLANHRRGEHRRNALADRLRQSLAEVAPRESGLTDVERALARLPDGDAEILRLVAWEELDHGEIAQVLGITRGTVRVRLHRARRRLAAEMTAQAARGTPPAISPGGQPRVVKRTPVSGHVVDGRAQSRPGTEEA